ncbi:MAG: DUF3343 domain-containing protein [Clostridiales bacterium]|nr:DUF3343 domain-containing protein [Clostridiales bacterium]
MFYYLIVCRSLTQAQRTVAALERSGITAHLLRTPRELAEGGCGYSVKISERNLKGALVALHRAELSPIRLYRTVGDGSYREVAL